jgi:hypothetical protein
MADGSRLATRTSCARASTRLASRQCAVVGLAIAWDRVNDRVRSAATQRAACCVVAVRTRGALSVRVAVLRRA